MLAGDFWCVAARCDGENCFKFQDPVDLELARSLHGTQFVTPIKPGGWQFQTFFYFHPYLGKIPIWTNIFQMG